MSGPEWLDKFWFKIDEKYENRDKIDGYRV
jgi:hypothetical protein